MTTSPCNFPDARILVIDDNPDNVRLVERVLQHVGYKRIIVMTDPGLAMRSVREAEPDLLLLDIRMPKHDGYEILSMMREPNSSLESVPVLVFTADKSAIARPKAFDAGASDFLTKPGDVEEIILRVRNFLHIRSLHLQLAASKAELESRVLERTKELSNARMEALEVLARAAEYRDDVTGWHAKRVGELSAMIARQMKLPGDLVEAVHLAAPLHDVGKIAVPDSILLSEGKLDEKQLVLMRRHTTVAKVIFGDAVSPLMRLALEIATCHHEQWNGAGYPEGLHGEAITLSARIVAVADVYDALTSERPYKQAVPHEVAVAEISAQSGHHFDPKVVKAFLEVVYDRGIKKAA